MFIGRIIGLLLGLLAFKNMFGIIVGFLVGWYFDKAMQQTLRDNRQNGNRQQVQPLFMQLLFTTMGRLAKSDGRVSEEEISHVENVIKTMGLDANGRQQAIDWFRQGVQQSTDLNALLQDFAQLSRGRLQLRRALLEMLLQQAMIDGQLHPNEEQLLLQVAEALGVPAAAFRLILQQLKAQHNFHQHYQHQGQHNSGAYTVRKDVLAEAYQVLGVQAGDSDAVVKKAYRKRMSENHPDKLIAQGLPEAAIKQATEKSQVIQQAYETIKKHRGSH